MTTITENLENEHKLLSSEEQAVLNKIAVQEPPFSLRAQALLAVNKGATQSEAGLAAGLTQGQVRYWLVKFRKDRMSIFPEELLDPVARVDADLPQSAAEPIASPDMQDLTEAEGEEEVQQEMPAVEETAEIVNDAAEPQEESPQAKKQSKKKSKKVKKSKKTGKLKKDKKTKKGKKPKKKIKKKKRKKTKKKGKK